MKLQMALDCKNFVQKEQDFGERESYLNEQIKQYQNINEQLLEEMQGLRHLASQREQAHLREVD